jgi:hypothetical protein
MIDTSTCGSMLGYSLRPPFDVFLMSFTGAVEEDTLLVGACIGNGLVTTTSTKQIRISPVIRRYCVTFRG